MLKTSTRHVRFIQFRVLRSSRSVLAWHVVRVPWRSAQALVHPPGGFPRPRTSSQAGVSPGRSIYHLAIVRIFQLLCPRVIPHPWYVDRGVYCDKKWRPSSLPSRTFRVVRNGRNQPKAGGVATPQRTHNPLIKNPLHTH